MKNVFYVIALLLSLGGAYFAYSNSEKLKNQQNKTVEVVGQKNRILANIKSEEEVLAGLNDSIKETDAAIATASAEMETAKGKQNSLKKTLAKYEGELQSIEEELEGFETLVEELETALGDIGLASIEEIPEKIEGLRTEVKEKEDKLEDVELIIGSLGDKIASNEVSLQDSQTKLSNIRQNLAKNADMATVTSVNSEWGFVIINKGSSNSLINEESELLVNRGGRYVGKLKVATLNENQTICDLDYEGFRGGSLVRPGDRVILKNSVGR